MSRTLSITFITCLGLLLSGQQLIAADDRQQAGIVLAARGQVTAQQGKQTPRILKRKDVFGLGEEISTAKNSLAQLRLQDGSLVTLNENSSYTVEQLNSSTSKNKSSISKLIKGGLKYLSGDDKNMQRILKAPIISMALRGTSLQAYTTVDKQCLAEENCCHRTKTGKKGLEKETCCIHAQNERKKECCFCTTAKYKPCVAKNCASTTVKVLTGTVDVYPTEQIPNSATTPSKPPIYTLTGGEGITQPNPTSSTHIQPTDGVNIAPSDPLSNLVETPPTINNNSVEIPEFDPPPPAI